MKDKVPATRLAANLGISLEKASEWIVGIWDGFSTGKLAEAEAWQKIETQYGQPINTEQRTIWYTWEELRPLPEMLELVRSLKIKGYVIGLLSNVLPVSARLIREHGGYDEFDFLVLSCEIGARKPAQLVYETALKNLGNIKPQEVVYLDDRKLLIDAAEDLEIIGLHVTDHAEAIKKIQKLILE